MVAEMLTVRLVGPEELGGFVLLGDFQELCRSLSRCLVQVERALAPQAGRVKYQIVKLEASSATLGIAPVERPKQSAPPAEVFGLFNRTVKALESGQAIDARLGTDGLHAFRNLADALTKRSSTELWIDGTRITKQYVAHIDAQLGLTIKSQGSISGTLERLNVHNCFEFALFPNTGGKFIRGLFQKELLPVVCEAIENQRTVTVHGELIYEPDGALPQSIRVARLELHPAASELPSLLSLGGMAPGITGDLSTLDFIKQLRDE